ncbi:hypothetical protein COY07_03465 [Candidatus Peregrinibacteria bacterium CG_4_10_14_0_2_um_filter_43_11]|nr:MAG: hypothetical protein COY07_03465 [Candidatus Peregrinibacteria bacterium CG_4_10_14_0_2_um_filter_43_11]
MEFLFRILGALGLLFITAGVLTKNRVHQNIVFIIGGILLTIYSAYIRDPIFMPLQVIFTFTAIYEFFRLKKEKN